MNIDQFRTMYPQYDSVPDIELTSRLHQKYYQNRTFEDFADEIGVTVSQQDRGFFGKIAESYRRGKSSTMADVAVYESAAKGLGNEDNALRIWKDSRQRDEIDKIDGNTLGDIVYGGARLLGQWGQSLKAGGTGAVVLGGLGAAAGAVAGAVIPTVGEEPFTIAAGAKLGLASGAKLGLAEGTALFMYKQGTGMMYANMLEQGVDKKTALKVASIAGIPYAIVEAYQAKQAIPALGGLMEEAMKRTSANLAKRIGIKYATTLGKEVGEEMLQEIIQITAEDVASEMGGMGIEMDAKYIEQRMGRILMTAVESAKAMALLPVPGAAWNMSVESAVNRNLMEEDAAVSMQHEGHQTSVTSWEQLAHLDEDQRDAIAGIVDQGELTLDEAVWEVQNLSIVGYQNLAVDEGVIKDNIVDATTAVDAMEEGTEIQGLADHSMLKRAFKKGTELLHNYGIRHARIRNIVKSIDGSANGVLSKLLLKPLRASTALGTTKRILAVRELNQTLETAGINIDEMYKTQLTLDNGQNITGAEALEVYMAQFDADKMRHLTQGNKMTVDQINEIVEIMDPRIKEFGNWTLDKYDKGHQSIAEVYKIVTGKELPKIEGYSRIFVDQKGLPQTVDYAKLVLEEMDRRGLHKRDVDASSTKERTKSVAPLRLDGFSNYIDNAMQVEWYKAVAPQVYKVGKILNDPEFQKRLNAKTHGLGAQIMSKWLQDIASERTTLETTWFSHVMNVMRKNEVVATLGLNFLSMMRQPLSTSLALAEDPKLILRAMGNFAQLARPGGMKATRDFVWSKSRMMQTRSIERELKKIYRGKDARAVLGKKPQLSEIAMAPIKFMDGNTVNVMWKSSYELAVSRNLTESQAVEYADGVIEKTQPMADIMDLPAFFRGSTLEKLFSVFQNQINQNINYWKYDILDAKKSSKISNKMVAYRVLMAYALPAMLMGLISRGRPPEDKKEVVQDLASYAVTPAFFFGSMASGMIQGYGVRLPVGMGMFHEVAKAVESPGQAPKRISGAIAKAMGLPWSQPRRTLEGIIAFGDGETRDVRRLVWNKYSLDQGQQQGAIAQPLSRRGRGRKVRSRGR